MRGKAAASAEFTVVLLQRVAGLRQSLEWLRQRQRARRVLALSHTHFFPPTLPGITL